MVSIFNSFFGENKNKDNEDPKNVYYDSENVKHVLKKKLGEGGQGAVYRTKDENIALKLLFDKEGKPLKSEEEFKKFSKTIDGIRILPLSKLNLAKPVSLLKSPHCGYTLRLLQDMIPISELIKPNADNLAQFYINSGGLKKRLLVLARTAEILARIHAKSIVYADISQNNIFISESNENSEVWLIDCDNLRFLSELGGTIYTPGFGAPEVVKGETGNTVLSDIYSFAILCYYTLVQAHPFLGEMVENGGGWDDDDSDEDEDMEEKAYSGEIPWVGDEDDNENFSETGIPREKILTNEILNLFRKTFEDGRMDKTKRPGLSLWAEELRKAADMTIKCHKCGSTFYANLKKCPFCNEARSGLILASVRHYDPELDIPFSNNTLWSKVINLDEDDKIYNFHVRPSIFRDDIETAFELKHTQNGLKIIKRDQNSYQYIDENRYAKLLDNTILLKTGGEIDIICGNGKVPSRFLTIKYYGV